MKSKVAVIGAGPAGLTAAYILSNNGVDVEVFEASDDVGGMAKSFELWNQIVDLGPHRFFSSDPRVNKIWLDVLEGEYTMVNRLTRIYYKKRFFSYPLKPGNALLGLGIFEAMHCVSSFFYSKIFPKKVETSFDNWVTNRFGKRLFSIFFKSYSEKLWGIPCSDLDADFAAQRIKKLSLYEAIKSAFIGSGSQKHKTLVDEFAYPLGGAGDVYKKMAEKIKRAGGKIHTKCFVDSVVARDETNIKPNLILATGEMLEFDHIVSTMPITKLVEKIGAPMEVQQAAKKLQFRNTILVYLRVEGASPFPDQWIYVHSPDLQTGRITNFRNWTKTINNGEADSILCLEFWCYDDDDLWFRNEEYLVKLAKDEIYKTGLIASASVKTGKMVKVPKCYPVYSKGYKEHLIPVQDYLSTLSGLSVIGRYGAFKYNNQDHSILMGLLAAENIANGKNHDLWQINTDYEYQEGSRITATGLLVERDAANVVVIKKSASV